ncbi:hypothetical protein QN277_000425 [Acacia crassicarpa]|uniref:Uncharacterized protein n=1 Tax=Acacia crassicarpa TaxID=499986 RepID=A0AAE1N5B4_9FABA|nr:hypothetical protein QN277_000425 [Acacia crassicarpa]
MNAGDRPLHAFGVSIIAMADIAYRKALEFDGPLGSTGRIIANLAEAANPIIYPVQCIWLAILSFLDDQFLVVQKITETLFPPSSHFFVKNDDLVLVIMSLPKKFDDALNKLPEIIHQLPVLERFLLYLISWLDCLVSILIRSESKEGIRFNSTSKSSEPSKAAIKIVNRAVSTQKGDSYKEALRNDDDEGVNTCVQKFSSYKGALMNDEDEGANASVLQKRGSYKEALMNDEAALMNDEAGSSGGTEEDDPILGLFESGWSL